MAIADIITTIEKKAISQGELIVNDAEMAVKQLADDAQKKGAQYSSSRFEQYEQKKDMLEKKASSEQVREEKMLISSLQHSEIESMYSDALSQVAKGKGDDLLSLLTSAISSIDAPKGELVSTGSDVKLLESALNESKKPFIVSKDMIDGMGGFIFKGAEYEMDFSFEHLFKTILKEQTEADILKNLV